MCSDAGRGDSGLGDAEMDARPTSWVSSQPAGSSGITRSVFSNVPMIGLLGGCSDCGEVFGSKCGELWCSNCSGFLRSDCEKFLSSSSKGEENKVGKMVGDTRAVFGDLYTLHDGLHPAGIKAPLASSGVACLFNDCGLGKAIV